MRAISGAGLSQHAVRFWMGANYTGFFDVDDIVVTWR